MYANKFNILFPIESTGRELEYKCILSSKLAELGHDCFVGEKSEIYKLIDLLEPVVYFDKGYHKGVSEKIYKNLKKKDAIILNLDEEGAVDYEDNRALLSRYPEKLLKFVDLLFLWGSGQLEILKKNYSSFDKRKFLVSGHPRLQLLKNHNNKNLSKERIIINSNFKNYYLITSNTSLGNNIKGDKFVISNYKDRIKDIKEIIKTDKIKLNLLIEFAINLAAKTNKQIVFRPHPEENFDIYKNAFINYKNITVNCDFSSIEWIKSCDVLIHPDCTTGVEGAIIGKNVISLLPKIDNKFITSIPIQMSVQYNSHKKLVEDLIKNKVKYENKDIKNIKEKFFSSDKDSFKIIIDFIKKIIKKRKRKKNFYLNFYNILRLKLHIL